MTQGLSREVEIDPHHAALLIIDVQNYTARRDGGEYRDLTEQEIEERFGFFFRTFEETERRSRSAPRSPRSEEHTSELQSRFDLVCRLLLEKKKKNKTMIISL